MYTIKQVIAKAKKWNNSYTEYNRIQLIDAYNTLNEDDQAIADKAIIRFLPVWAEA